jgi:UDP-N-acetyl-D-glucosamine dehydrogenase
MTKLLENIFRSVNIAGRRAGGACDRMDIPVWRSSTRPRPLFASCPSGWPGPGRPLHPDRPLHLTWKAREFDFHTESSSWPGNNSQMPVHCVQLGARSTAGKAINGTRGAGVAYKSDVNDTRESPSCGHRPLREDGAEVAYSDPHVPVLGARHAGVGRPRGPARLPTRPWWSPPTDVDWEMVAREARCWWTCATSCRARARRGCSAVSVRLGVWGGTTGPNLVCTPACLEG